MNGWLSSPLRNVAAGISFVTAIGLIAGALYVALGWSVPDALYMVVTTIFTVGYGEVRPVNTAALRAVTMGLIVTGCTGMIFVTGALVQLITASQFAQLLGSRRMQREIDALQGHVVVCGYGRIGQMLTRELTQAGTAAVVLERDSGRAALAREHGILVLEADATEEDELLRAGLTRARALAIVLPDDAANVFITLSARSLNPGLTIIARGEAPSTERKLLQAGANRVVLPAHIGAERVAELLLYEDLAALLDGLAAGAGAMRDLRQLGLELEVLPVAVGSVAAGITVAELQMRAAGALMVVALRPGNGGELRQPPQDYVICAGDGVAVLRRPGNLSGFEALFGAA